jgi:transcription antitermination factor NusG
MGVGSTLPLQHGFSPQHTCPNQGEPFPQPDAFLCNWHAVFTLTNHEKRVAANCQLRQIESFLPVYRVRHRWKNRCTVDLDLPLFPNYFFVRIAAQNRIRVLQVPGVVSIVSSGGQLLPVPADYITALRDGLLTHKIEPHADLQAGDLVRIKTGPFTGTEGILERRKGDLRVVLRLEMLARSVSVEVAAQEIEWCEHSAHSILR